MKQIIILIWWSFIYLASGDGPYFDMGFFSYQILVSLILISGYILIGCFNFRKNLIQLMILSLLTGLFAMFSMVTHLEWIRGGELLYDNYLSIQKISNAVELSVILFNSVLTVCIWKLQQNSLSSRNRSYIS